MMRKLVTLVLLASGILGFTACSGEDTEEAGVLTIRTPSGQTVETRCSTQDDVAGDLCREAEAAFSRGDFFGPVTRMGCDPRLGYYSLKGVISTGGDDEKIFYRWDCNGRAMRRLQDLVETRAEEVLGDGAGRSGY